MEHKKHERWNMKKEMLINVLQPEECRIAILEDGVLEELYVERTSHESYVGNIYKGRIVNIEPSIQAAFVDFGVGRNGFLHVSDVEPAYYRHLLDQQQTKEKPRRGGRSGKRSGVSRPNVEIPRPEAPPEVVEVDEDSDPEEILSIIPYDLGDADVVRVVHEVPTKDDTSDVDGADEIDIEDEDAIVEVEDIEDVEDVEVEDEVDFDEYGVEDVEIDDETENDVEDEDPKTLFGSFGAGIFDDDFPDPHDTEKPQQETAGVDAGEGPANFSQSDVSAKTQETNPFGSLAQFAIQYLGEEFRPSSRAGTTEIVELSFEALMFRQPDTPLFPRLSSGQESDTERNEATPTEETSEQSTDVVVDPAHESGIQEADDIPFAEEQDEPPVLEFAPTEVKTSESNDDSDEDSDDEPNSATSVAEAPAVEEAKVEKPKRKTRRKKATTKKTKGDVGDEETDDDATKEENEKPKRKRKTAKTKKTEDEDSEDEDKEETENEDASKTKKTRSRKTKTTRKKSADAEGTKTKSKTRKTKSKKAEAEESDDTPEADQSENTQPESTDSNSNEEAQPEPRDDTPPRPMGSAERRTREDDEPITDSLESLHPIEPKDSEGA